MDAARRILRYVKSTLQYGLFYEIGVEIQLHGYTDADWAGSIFNRRSSSGYMFFFGSVAVTWSSKKQAIVALSSTEVEYRSVAVAACEVA